MKTLDIKFNDTNLPEGFVVTARLGDKWINATQAEAVKLNLQDASGNKFGTGYVVACIEAPLGQIPKDWKKYVYPATKLTEYLQSCYPEETINGLTRVSLILFVNAKP